MAEGRGACLRSANEMCSVIAAAVCVLGRVTVSGEAERLGAGSSKGEFLGLALFSVCLIKKRLN